MRGARCSLFYGLDDGMKDMRNPFVRELITEEPIETLQKRWGYLESAEKVSWLGTLEKTLLQDSM